MKEGQPPFNGVPLHASWFDVNSLFLKFFIGFWILGQWMNIEYSLKALMTREGIALFWMSVIAQASLETSIVFSEKCL